MDLTKNEERLYQWAVNNHKKINDECLQESNWHIIDAAGDRLIEYNVQTLKEMQENLEDTGLDSDISLIFSAEAMKWKMMYFMEKETKSKLTETGLPASQDIPEFVYRF